MRTRLPLLLILVSAAGLAPLAQSKQTLLMNRLGPSQMTLYIADGDGSGERPLLASSSFDYNASFSPDGHWIVFTSERAGDPVRPTSIGYGPTARASSASPTIPRSTIRVRCRPTGTRSRSSRRAVPAWPTSGCWI